MKLSIGKCWGLLVFDLVSLAIAGYAYLLGFQIIQTLPQANAFIILMAFFIGIKIVILALYDLNRHVMLKNIPFIGGSITILGNGIIFGISLFLIPEVPYYFFIGLAIADFILVTLSHFLWWVIMGKETLGQKAQEDKPSKNEKGKKTKKDPKNKKETKGKWLSGASEEDEYDSIFDALLEKNQHNLPLKSEKDTTKPPIPPRNIFEEEKKYETGEFLKDIQKNRNQALEKPKSGQDLPIKWEIESDSLANQEPVFHPNEGPASQSEFGLTDQVFDLKEEKIDLTTDPFAPKEDGIDLGIETFSLEEDKSDLATNTQGLTDQDFTDQEVKDPDQSSPVEKSETKGSPQILVADKEFILDQPSFNQKKTLLREGEKNDRDLELEETDDFNSIEKRLGLLLNEIENSMQETHYLQEAISVFNQEVEDYKPIKGDEKILAAGSLIREKLKAIIDKQFVVDEVLDDLIHLSKVINKRIDDLDRIEAGLDKRKVSLDQKEAILIENNKISKGRDIEILPEELVVENLDSEYIVAGEDYEIVQRYLKRIK